LENVTAPLPVIATVANCWALTKVCGVETGTPNDKSAGDIARVGLGVCAFDTTPNPAKQHTAATRVIERTTTFHAIMSFLLEALELAIISRNLVPCGAFQVTFEVHGTQRGTCASRRPAHKPA